jgi:hypothetical protein
MESKDPPTARPEGKHHRVQEWNIQPLALHVYHIIVLSRYGVMVGRAAKYYSNIVALKHGVYRVF